eukprot:COSAG06_NODE_8940_length_2027_cov_92.797718_4_plen_70_part_00
MHVFVHITCATPQHQSAAMPRLPARPSLHVATLALLITRCEERRKRLEVVAHKRLLVISQGYVLQTGLR